MIEGHCHCRAVRVAVPVRPETLGDCNCSLCSRLGTLWGYYPSSEVSITDPEKKLVGYVQGDRTLTMHHCGVCGCITHWSPVGRSSPRMGSTCASSSVRSGKISRTASSTARVGEIGSVCLGPSDSAHQEQDQQDHDQNAENSRRAVTPAGRVGPGRKGADQKQDQNNEEDGAKHIAVLPCTIEISANEITRQTEFLQRLLRASKVVGALQSTSFILPNAKRQNMFHAPRDPYMGNTQSEGAVSFEARSSFSELSHPEQRGRVKGPFI